MQLYRWFRIGFAQFERVGLDAKVNYRKEIAQLEAKIDNKLQKEELP